MSPSSPNSADLSNDQRERVLKRTTATLRELDEIRRGLELPVEHLPIVIETYNKEVASLVAETERAAFAQRTSRIPITMRSENRDYESTKIPRGKITAVVVRPQFVAFRPEDFAIHGDRSHWLVHDIKVGNSTQFNGKRGPAAGTEFGPGGICEHLRLETVQTAMDLALVVEYVGPEPDGEVFEATIVGTAVV
jgi:hypothetical protein